MTHEALQIQGLTKAYGKKVALDGLSLTVDDGEVFGLLGHNGAGKTTTVNLLTTLLKPTAGDALVAGSSIVTSPNQVRSAIGYLPENVRFYDNLTVRENLRFFGKLSGLRHPDDRISTVLELVSFADHDDERVGTFSKGMRQRVGLAQAILHEPRVLFLDEPTSGLDPLGVRSLRELIVRLNAELGMTIFMNTHLLSEVTKTCTSIGVLRQGTLVHHDTLTSTLSRFPDESSLEEIYFRLDAAVA